MGQREYPLSLHKLFRSFIGARFVLKKKVVVNIIYALRNVFFFFLEENEVKMLTF